MERSAVEGEDYEQKVVQIITAIARAPAAPPAGLVGDIIVEVEPATTYGGRGIYVLQCKDRKLSERAILDELQEAAANRDAQAATAVFSLPEYCPVPDLFRVPQHAAD